jgi:PEP-CTERM motif
MLKSSFKKYLGIATFFSCFAASSVNAVVINDATVLRPDFIVNNARSYDGPDFNFIRAVSSFTTGQAFSLSEFTGLAGSVSRLEVHLVAEAACFDGRLAGKANKFGVVDDNGAFINILDSATAKAGDSNFIVQNATDNFLFALQSPEALFVANDSENADKSAHIIGMRVDKDGILNLPSTDTRGGAPLQFQLFAGDIVLFIEDMMASGNRATSSIPNLADFDYNDMVVVVRNSSTAVPEPSTMALLSCGLFGLKFRRKKIAS